MNQSTELMKIQHSRTGLKLEKRLYLRAQSHAASLNHSFAAYVIDLIAADLVGLPETEDIPDIKRIIRTQRPAAADIHARHKQESELVHQSNVSEHPPGSPMRDLRQVSPRLKPGKK